MHNEPVKCCGGPDGCRWYVPTRPNQCDDVCGCPLGGSRYPAYEKHGKCGPDGKNWEARIIPQKK